jgi:hypothetical protein
LVTGSIEGSLLVPFSWCPLGLGPRAAPRAIESRPYRICDQPSRILIRGTGRSSSPSRVPLRDLADHIARDTGLSLLLFSPRKEVLVAKGIEKGKKENKPKLSIKEKQKKKKEKKERSGG